MGSINHGIQKLRAAEVRRGCRLSERFESQVEVERNGGVIAGIPTISNKLKINSASDYVQYGITGNKTAKAFTFFIRNIKLASYNASTSYLANNFQVVNDGFTFEIRASSNPEQVLLIKLSYSGTFMFITKAINYDDIKNMSLVYDGSGATNDDKFKIYSDGVQLSGLTYSAAVPSAVNISPKLIVSSGLSVGSEIGETRFINTALSPAEILAYHNGTMWDYNRPENLVLCMDGRARNHDPSNNRVLDVSGNGNHLTKGDGTTASTFPTKRNGLGYNFDGGDYFEIPITTLDITQPFSLFIAHKKNLKPALNNNDRFFSFVDDADNYVQITVADIGLTYNAELKVGGVFVVENQNYDVVKLSQLEFITSVYDGSSFKMYRNSQEMSTNGTTSTSSGATQKYMIGIRSDLALSTEYDGDIYAIYIFQIALNPTQIIDLQNSINPNERGA